MTPASRFRGPLAAAILGSALLLSACASGAGAEGPGMVGGYGAGAMMGTSGYRNAPLTCSAPPALPGTTVRVVAGDMGMASMMSGIAPMAPSTMSLSVSPAKVPAGRVSIVVQNMGWRTHEVVVLPLAAGTAAGQRVPGADGKVDETGSVGEVSSNCAEGTGDGIASGGVGWTTLTLPAGHYEILCNLQNHYANGMWAELTVT